MNSVFLGALAWITVNVYLLPFSVWTAGITRPWFIMQGYIPYKDFVWLRMPLDLFLLSGWYTVFGPAPQAYQGFIFVLLAIIAALLFFVCRVLIPRFGHLSFLFFAIFLFPLFQNAEVDEMMVGLWAILIFAFMAFFLTKKKLRYLFLTGVISGMSLMTKQTSGFVIIAIFISIIFNFFLSKNTIKNFLISIGVFGLGLFIPILFIVAYFIINHSLGDFLHYTIFFNFGSVYEGWSPAGDGLWIVAGYISLLFPFIIFWKNTKLMPQIIFFITLEILSLFPSLLPSAISYKAFTSFTLVSIVAGCDIMLLLSLRKHRGIILLFFALFIIFTQNFILSYFSSNPGFAPNQLLEDFDKPQYEIADLVKSRTNNNDKIISYGSEIIYLMANRLPKNKYIDPFPYMLKPYDASLKVFTNDPPKIVVYDESLPADQPGLSDWPGIQFFRENYKVIGRYGDTFVVLEYNKK